MRTDRRLGPLSSRDFRLFLVGRLTSFIGTGMLPVALAFAVLGRHGSTSEVGYVLGAETLPLVVFLLVGGAAADRLNRRVVMLSADVLRAVAQGVLAAWILVGRPPLWGFLVTQALVGTGNAFFTPAMTGLIPEVAPAETLQQANVLNSMAEWSGRFFGPALAGVIVATAGPGWAVGADAVTYFLSALCLAGLRVGWSGTAATESFVAQLRTGWRAFRSRTWLWSIVAQFSSYGFFVFAPFFVLGAVVAEPVPGGRRGVGNGSRLARSRVRARQRRDAAGAAAPARCSWPRSGSSASPSRWWRWRHGAPCAVVASDVLRLGSVDRCLRAAVGHDHAEPVATRGPVAGQRL